MFVHDARATAQAVLCGPCWLKTHVSRCVVRTAQEIKRPTPFLPFLTRRAAAAVNNQTRAQLKILELTLVDCERNLENLGFYPNHPVCLYTDQFYAHFIRYEFRCQIFWSDAPFDRL